MPQTQVDPSEDEIFAIIYAFEQDGTGLKRRIAEIWRKHSPSGQTSEEQEQRNHQVIKALHRLVARRLHANNHNVPLLSANDMASLALEACGLDESNDSDELIRMQSEIGMVAGFNADAMAAKIGQGPAAYATYWRLIDAVKAVSSQWHVPVDRLVASQAGRDEVVRSMHDPCHFSATGHASIRPYTDRGKLAKSLRDPARVSLSQELGRYPSRAEVDAEVEAQLGILMEIYLEIADAMHLDLDARMLRIWGVNSHGLSPAFNLN